MEKTPVYCDREMWAVINRRTSLNAISKEHDTPVWRCIECGKQIVRNEAPAT